MLHTKKRNDPSACDVNVKYWPGSVDAVSVTVRPATKTDVPAVATVLADAFFDDPVMAWMWPDEGRREHGLRRYFAAEARFHSVPVGGADIAERDEIVGGAALWAPPGAWKPTVWQSLRMWPRLAVALGGHPRAGIAVSAALEAVHPAEPHWYLSTLGSASHSRGGGFGAALLRSRLDRCDATHAPAYLESSKEVNIGYYERFGFEVTREIAIPRGGPTLWAMWRNPR